MDLRGQIKQSIEVLDELTGSHLSPDEQIPRAILRNAKGLVFMTQIKAGFIWTGKVGTGIIIQRTPGVGLGWSAPSSVGTGGVGFGFQVGAQKTDTVIVLNDFSSVKAFSGNGQLKFGGDVAVSAGPIGRNLSADARVGDGGFAGCFSYSHSQGIFAGLSLEGAVLLARTSDNRSFYKSGDLSVESILSGNVEPPCEAYPLYEKLNQLCCPSSLGDAPAARAIATSASAPAAPATTAAPPTVPAAPPPPMRGISKRLPPGWVALTSPEGEVYYHNADLNATQWEFPESADFL